MIRPAILGTVTGTEAGKSTSPKLLHMPDPPESILSHGERDVARYLRDGDGVEEIAEARGASAESVRKSIDRIRGKTRRALATLEESPYVEDAALELDDATREALLDALRPEE